MSVGQTRPFESNRDDPKMSDPSTSSHVSPEAQLESSEDEPSAGTVVLARGPDPGLVQDSVPLDCSST